MASSDDIRYYDSDHTALVHVLWAARRDETKARDWNSTKRALV